MNKFRLKQKLIAARDRLDVIIKTIDDSTPEIINRRITRLSIDTIDALTYIKNHNHLKYSKLLSHLNGHSGIFEKITKEVARNHNIGTPDILWLKDRRLPIMLPRQIAQYLQMECTGGMSSIVANYWGMSHSTIIHNYNVIKNRVKFEKGFEDKHITPLCIGNKKITSILSE